MKKLSLGNRPILRLARVLLFAAPLTFACATGSNAESPPTSETAEGTLVAANAAAGDKDANKAADMKEVILNVFGMT